jgi:hypothetical protein
MAPGPLGALRTAHAGLLALGLDSYGPDLKIFALGVAVPIATARVGVSGLGVIKSGLLITPDARTIFAVTPHDVYNTNISVQVLPTASLL